MIIAIIENDDEIMTVTKSCWKMTKNTHDDDDNDDDDDDDDEQF